MKSKILFSSIAIVMIATIIFSCTRESNEFSLSNDANKRVEASTIKLSKAEIKDKAKELANELSFIEFVKLQKEHLTNRRHWLDTLPKDKKEIYFEGMKKFKQTKKLPEVYHSEIAVLKNLAWKKHSYLVNFTKKFPELKNNPDLFFAALAILKFEIESPKIKAPSTGRTEQFCNCNAAYNACINGAYYSSLYCIWDCGGDDDCIYVCDIFYEVDLIECDVDHTLCGLGY